MTKREESVLPVGTGHRRASNAPSKPWPPATRAASRPAGGQRHVEGDGRTPLVAERTGKRSVLNDLLRQLGARLSGATKPPLTTSSSKRVRRRTGHGLPPPKRACHTTTILFHLQVRRRLDPRSHRIPRYRARHVRPRRRRMSANRAVMRHCTFRIGRRSSVPRRFRHMTSRKIVACPHQTTPVRLTPLV